MAAPRLTDIEDFGDECGNGSQYVTGAVPQDRVRSRVSGQHAIDTQTRSTNQAEACFGVSDPSRMKEQQRVAVIMLVTAAVAPITRGDGQVIAKREVILALPFADFDQNSASG
jgi:hypothetical protein